MGHYYASDGTPVHTQRKKGGGTRDTTLADAKKQGLFPSVTTVLDVLAKHGLNYWREEKIIEATLKFDTICVEDVARYSREVREAAFSDVGNAADLGTLIHADIEGLLLGEKSEWQVRDEANAAVRHMESMGLSICESEARIVNHRHGYAGTADIVATKDSRPVVLDFKTKATKPGKKIEPSENHPTQIAAYWMGYWGIEDAFPKPTALGYNVYISTTEPGRIETVEWSAEVLRHEWELFRHVLAIWRARTGHDPRQPITANTHE